MRSIRPIGFGLLSRRALFATAALPLLLSACGGPGGGGGLVELPGLVIVDDAPIVNALVQDKDGGQGAQVAVALGGGQYRFATIPVLPLKISSRNLVGADGRVNVGLLNGVWYSYIDTNGNGSIDSFEPRELLTFQDLDRNGIYTQSADIVYNGAINVNYVPRGAAEIQANVVSSLLPSNWDGATPVAGLSSTVLNDAVTKPPSKSGNIELQRATATLTAISEGLLSTLRSSGASGSTAAAQATISSALAAVAAPGAQIDLTKSDAPSVAKLAQTISQAVPAAAQTQASNLVTNVKVVQASANPSTATESIVKVTQERLSIMTAAPDPLQQAKLKNDVELAASAIVAAQTQVPDPDAERIKALRLIPLGFPDVNIVVPETWISLEGTTGFSLARQADGSLLFRAAGGPFQEVLGAASREVRFVSSSNNWEYIGPLKEALKIKVNHSVPKALFNDTLMGAFNEASSMQLCTKNNECVYFFLFSPEQLCRPDWQAMVGLGNADSGAKSRFYNALNAINRAAGRPDVICN
jgi:hypothetical protein